jgi:hypothetical protein
MVISGQFVKFRVKPGNQFLWQLFKTLLWIVENLPKENTKVRQSDQFVVILLREAPDETTKKRKYGKWPLCRIFIFRSTNKDDKVTSLRRNNLVSILSFIYARSWAKHESTTKWILFLWFWNDLLKSNLTRCFRIELVEE